MDSPFSFITLFFLCFSLIACSPTPDDSKQLADNIRVRHSFLNAAAIKMAAEKGTDTTVKKEDAIKELSWPNDVYKLKSTDGTLNFETDAHGVRLKDVNYADTDKVFGALDGWSVSAPMVIHLNVPDHKQFNPSTISGDSVRIYEISLRGPLAEQPECRNGSNMHICTNQEITRHTFVAPEDIAYETSDDYNTSYTVHYVEGKNKLEIKPIAPLKQASSYLIVLTSALKDTEGNPLRGSIDFELMQKPESMNPKLDDIQAMLQNHVHIIANHENESSKNIIYTAHFSTLSSNTTFKHIMAKMLEDTKNKIGDYQVKLTPLQHADEGAGFEANFYIKSSLLRNTSKPQSIQSKYYVHPKLKDAEEGINKVVGLTDYAQEAKDQGFGSTTQWLAEQLGKDYFGAAFVSKELIESGTKLYIAQLERPSFSKNITASVDCDSNPQQSTSNVLSQISDKQNFVNKLKEDSGNTHHTVDFNEALKLESELAKVTSDNDLEIAQINNFVLPKSHERYSYAYEIVPDQKGLYDKNRNVIKEAIEEKKQQSENQKKTLTAQLNHQHEPSEDKRYKKHIFCWSQCFTQDPDGEYDIDGNKYRYYEISDEISAIENDIETTKEMLNANNINHQTVPLNERYIKTDNEVLIANPHGTYGQNETEYDFLTVQDKTTAINILKQEKANLRQKLTKETQKQEAIFSSYLKETHKYSFGDFHIKRIMPIDTCKNKFKTQWQAASTSLASLSSHYRNLPPNEQVEFITQMESQTNNEVNFSKFRSDSSLKEIKQLKKELSWWGAKNSYAALKYNGQKIDEDQLMTRYNPLPRVMHREALDVVITTPKDEAADGKGWPLVILVHGITGRKEDNLLLAKAYTEKGIATISIDLPLHGSRGIDLDDDEINDITTTRYGEPNHSSLAFMYLKNMLVARDNLRQSMVDILALRLAISQLPENADGALEISQPSKNADGTPKLNPDGTPQVTTLKFNQNNIGLQAFSLGAIISTSVLAHSGHDLSEFFDDNTTTFNKDDSPFKFHAGVLVAPAMGLAGMLINSPEFKDEIIPSIKEIWEENNTTNARWEDEKNDAIETFLLLSQALVDVGEPTSSVVDLRDLVSNRKTPLLMIEIEGDETIGNSVIEIDSMESAPHSFMPSSGTSPLFHMLGLNTTIQANNNNDLDICSNSSCDAQSFSLGLHVKESSGDKLTHISLLSYAGYQNNMKFSAIGAPYADVQYNHTPTKALQDIVTGYFETFFDRQNKNTIAISNDSLVINP